MPTSISTNVIKRKTHKWQTHLIVGHICPTYFLKPVNKLFSKISACQILSAKSFADFFE
jgi:cAMP phosphodiesterase